MLTKTILKINSEEIALGSDNVKNWDDIRYAYKRDGLSGVVRSFSSKFEFVGHAYDLLLNEYLTNGVNAYAAVMVQTIDNNWRWHDAFTCPLDFSTLSTEDKIMTISAIDSSIAALIKSGKGTTYEFKIGDDIMPDGSLYYDHLPLRETATYEFTEGIYFENKADIRVQYKAGERIFMGNVGSEVVVNGCVYYNDNQTSDADAYLIQAYKDITITLDVDIVYATNAVTSGGTALYACVEKNGSIISSQKIGEIPTRYNASPVGYFENYDDLTAFQGSPKSSMEWANVNGAIYIASGSSLSGLSWTKASASADVFFRETLKKTLDIVLKSGERVVIATSETGKNRYSGEMYLFRQSFVFSWLAKGEPCNIDMFRPLNVVKKILGKIYGGKYPVRAEISDHDARLADTMIIAGESVRGLNNAKIYTSFNDFCDWMETVFGYTYYIGKQKPPYSIYRESGKVLYNTDGLRVTSGSYSGEVNTENIRYSPSDKCFYYLDGVWCRRSWPNSPNYNSYDDGPFPRARKGVMFYIILENGEKDLIYFTEGTDEPQHLAECIKFVHRSEIFRSDLPVKVMRNPTEVKYSIDAQRIYSSVDIGYEKKDYDSINGRDEFNFNIEYSIDCPVSNKKLSMRSKYRADCYGLEFLALKRSEGTTDSSSDKNIFFLRVQGLTPVDLRKDGPTITGVLTDKVYNGEFSPASCVKANAGIIGTQSDEVTLIFASSGGNADVAIDGSPLNSDITLTEPIVTVGELEFTSDAITPPDSFDGLVCVEHNCLRYTGYISQAEYHFARTEAVKYNLLVKTVVPC